MSRDQEEITILPGQSFEYEQSIIHQNEHLTMKGRLLVRLVEHFGVVSCIEDGHDEAGRQKLRLMTPTEVVDRATAISHHTIECIRANGWCFMMDPPKLDEEIAEKKAIRAGSKAKV